MEKIDVDSPVSALRRRSLQAAPLRPVIAHAGGISAKCPDDVVETALVVLPIAPIPKGPLLEFDVHGPAHGEAFLIQRADIATREAAFIASSARRVDLPIPTRALAVIEAALGFTEAQWVRFRPDMATYLVNGLESAFDPAAADACLGLTKQAADLLRPFAEVPAPLDSAVENPALVVPSLVAEGTLTTADAVLALTEYVEWLTLLRVLADEGGPKATDAETVLEALVDYGTNYDLMAIVEVPLDESFLVKVSDRRPLDLSLLNGGEQSVVIADARSNHIALRVTDPNARLAKVRAKSLAKGRDAYGTFTSRESPEVHAFYTFEPDRDYRIQLTFRVALLRRLQIVPYSLAAILVLTAAAVVGLQPAPRDLVLTVGPATFAASVLLVREPSALGSRLRVITTALVMVATAVLVVVAALDIWWTYDS